jgi:CubicO group peptidase (beta-lactamase class C family)
VTLKSTAAVLALAFAGLAHAAPPADPQLVDLFSRMEAFHAAHDVRKADAPRDWKRAAPSAEIDKIVDAFLDAHANTGLMVVKGDTVLAERYQYGRTAQHRLESASMAKTVLGMLVGFAVHEGKLSLDDKAEKYVPALKGHVFGDASVRDLLTMSSGVAWDGNLEPGGDAFKLIGDTLFQKSPGGADAVLRLSRRIAPAGKRFAYSDADNEVLGLVLAAAVRQPLAAYLSEKIWQPMGAESNAAWLVDKGGQEVSYCCVQAVLRDFARFGMLLAHYGALDGRQIIPAGWVKAATTPEAPHLAVGVASTYNGYGYQTWIIHKTEPRFGAFGIRGQAIFVDAASKLVVVHTAVWADGRDQNERAAQFELWHTLLEKTAQKSL